MRSSSPNGVLPSLEAALFVENVDMVRRNGCTMAGVAVMLLCKSWVQTTWFTDSEKQGRSSVLFLASIGIRPTVNHYGVIDALWGVMLNSTSSQNSWRLICVPIICTMLQKALNPWASQQKSFFDTCRSVAMIPKGSQDRWRLNRQ